MSGKNISTRPRSSWNRRSDALDMTGQIGRDRTDTERRKRVRKRTPGAVRVCSACAAVSAEKRWVTDPETIARIRNAAGRAIEPTLCPGCARVRAGRVDGWVRLEGQAVRGQEDEIRNLVYNILEDSRRDDPVHRVVSWHTAGTKMEIETTSQWLAETIGKAIQRDLGGELDIRFIPDEEFVRVYWKQRG